MNPRKTDVDLSMGFTGFLADRCANTRPAFGADECLERDIFSAERALEER